MSQTQILIFWKRPAAPAGFLWWFSKVWGVSVGALCFLNPSFLNHGLAPPPSFEWLSFFRNDSTAVLYKQLHILPGWFQIVTHCYVSQHFTLSVFLAFPFGCFTTFLFQAVFGPISYCNFLIFVTGEALWGLFLIFFFQTFRGEISYNNNFLFCRIAV